MTGGQSQRLAFASGKDGEGSSLSAQMVQAAASLPDIFSGLNEAQRQAVQSLDGPQLVLACAGTGKTRVLTTRIANLLMSGKARPSQILAVTFTNKAAVEMRQRVADLVGPLAEGMPWLGTFHSVSAKLLRRHAECIGLRPNFTILDTDDQLRLLKQILEAAGVDTKLSPPRLLLAIIDGLKNRGKGPDQVTADMGGEGFRGNIATYYRAYQSRLKALNAVDFGDLILEVIHLLKKNPEVLDLYHERFRYIMVDEYQDSNIAQYLWLRLLAQGRNNLCCVGDDDQSIYGWRGAEVGNILRFERDFPEARIIRLEDNYRSSAAILATASHLIAHNRQRLEKTLKTKAEEGEKVRLIGCWDAEEEARQVTEDMVNLCEEGHSPDSMAILVRTSSQMRAFEDRMAMIGLPYRVIGGPKFYERLEIRDAIAYLRLVSQQSDDLAFERIVNQPRRGFGDTSLQKLIVHARAAGLSFFDAGRELVETDEIRGQARAALRRFVEDIDRWRQKVEELPLKDVAGLILEESGYCAMWQADKSADAPGRLDNLKELVRSLGDYESLSEFLEHIALIMDVDQAEDSARVSLMTLHAAKGLEFDTVYLPGWEDGLFPSQRSLDETGEAGLEEERRLAYVGITRARRRLSISYAANRQVYGQWQQSLPSRFIDELPAACVEIVGRQRTGYASSSSSSVAGRSGREASLSTFDFEPETRSPSSPGWQRLQEARKAAARVHERVGLHPRARSGQSFEAGQLVIHDTWGRGVITSVDGDKASVDFDRGESKRILTSFLKRA